MDSNLKSQVENLFQKVTLNQRTELSDSEKELVQTVLGMLDAGSIRVAEPPTPNASSEVQNKWKIHEWIKKSILLYFRIQNLSHLQAGDLNFWDKIPLKRWTGQEGVRTVPPSVTRHGAYVAPGAILMPSFVNIGAYVGSGTMVDTWATVGSCAQIGKNVHLSGGVGIGGVLEPLQAYPVIVEDEVFVGSRCILVEGVHIQEGAVLGAGVTLTASTHIIDVTEKRQKEYRGFVPKYSIVIPGAYTKTYPAGEFQVPCALIIGKRSAETDKKISLNQALRLID